jgi:RPA family protein
MKFICAILLLTPLIGLAADGDNTLVIKDHKFEPAELVIPAGEKVRLFIVNKDTSPEEFESYSLNREKVVAGNGTIKMYIGPLQPGRYPFIGEFNQATAQGVIVAK